jgi:hypothetical protein
MSHEDDTCSFAFDLLLAARHSLGFSPFRARICGCTHLRVCPGTCAYAYYCDRRRDEVARGCTNTGNAWITRTHHHARRRFRRGVLYATDWTDAECGGARGGAGAAPEPVARREARGCAHPVLPSLLDSDLMSVLLLSPSARL